MAPTRRNHSKSIARQTAVWQCGGTTIVLNTNTCHRFAITTLLIYYYQILAIQLTIYDDSPKLCVALRSLALVTRHHRSWLGFRAHDVCPNRFCRPVDDAYYCDQCGSRGSARPCPGRGCLWSDWHFNAVTGLPRQIPSHPVTTISSPLQDIVQARKRLATIYHGFRDKATGARMFMTMAGYRVNPQSHSRSPPPNILLPSSKPAHPNTPGRKPRFSRYCKLEYFSEAKRTSKIKALQCTSLLAHDLRACSC